MTTKTAVLADQGIQSWELYGNTEDVTGQEQSVGLREANITA